MCFYTTAMSYSQCSHVAKVQPFYIPPQYCKEMRQALDYYHSQPQRLPESVPVANPRPCPIFQGDGLTPGNCLTLKVMGICETCTHDLNTKCSQLEETTVALEAELAKTIAELKVKEGELDATSRTMVGDQTKLQRLEDELKDERANRQAAEEALTRSTERSKDLPDFMEGLTTTSDPAKGGNGHAGGRMTKSLIDLQDEDAQENNQKRRQSFGFGIEK